VSHSQLITELWHPVPIYLWDFAHLWPLQQYVFSAEVCFLAAVLLVFSPGFLVGFTPVSLFEIVSEFLFCVVFLFL
jgi:hypothetical protein